MFLNTKLKEIVPHNKQVVSYSGTFSDRLNIIYYLDSFCNYSCTYCAWYTNLKSPIDTLQTQKDIIQALFDNTKSKANLFIYGGEPTLYKSFELLIQFIFERRPDNFTVELQSNGSRGLSYFSEHLLKYDDLMYSLSYHHSQITNPGQTDRFFELTNHLHLAGKLIRVDYMCEEENVEEQIEILNSLKKTKWAHKILLTYGYYDLKNAESFKLDNSKEFSEINVDFQLQEMYNVNSIEYNTSDLFHSDFTFKGMRCDAGKKMIIIDWRGDYSTCTSAWLNSDKYNILENPKIYRLLTSTSKVCGYNKCNGDFWVSKW
jgi:MoaA/NifB/PqqE/SkfB family radical SAM enzyme